MKVVCRNYYMRKIIEAVDYNIVQFSLPQWLYSKKKNISLKLCFSYLKNVHCSSKIFNNDVKVNFAILP